MFVNVGHIKIQKFIQYQQGGSKLSFFRLFEIDFHVEPDSFQALKNYSLFGYATLVNVDFKQNTKQILATYPNYNA